MAHAGVNGMLRGELATATGCNAETIRYYEKIGLLPPPTRTAKGYRVYAPAHARRLRFIARARDLGFAIADIRALLEMVDGGVQTCAEVAQRSQAQLDEVRAKIADLQRVEAVLADMVARCSGAEVPDCAVIEALSA